MQSRDFCYWLQGFFEITGRDSEGEIHLSPDQIDIIKKHLDLVFVHEIDPSMGDQKHQDKLNEIHSLAIPEVTGHDHNWKMRC